MWNAQRMDDRGYGTGTAVLVGDAIITRLRAAEVMAAPAGAVTGGRGIFEDALSRAAARMIRTIRISRVLTGMFLVLHGIAHARAGTTLTDPTGAWRLFQGTMLETLMLGISGILWAASTIGFVAGGLGLLGVAGLRHFSRRLILTAVLASVLLLALAAQPYALAGALIDVALFGLLGFADSGRLRGRWLWHRTLLEDAASPTRRMTTVHRAARTAGSIAG